MSNTTHTKLEWKISPNPIHKNNQGSAWVKYIINQPPLNSRIIADVYGETRDEVEANAAFICLAVNNHDKLVDLLTEFVGAKNDQTHEDWIYRLAVKKKAEQLLQSINQ